MVGIKFKEINKGEHLLFESNDTVVEYYDSLVNIPIVGFVTSSAFDNNFLFIIFNLCLFMHRLQSLSNIK